MSKQVVPTKKIDPTIFFRGIVFSHPRGGPGTQIFYLEDGLIVENGSYDQLIADKKQFYALTKIQNTN